MPSLNKIMLIGHVGREGELRYLANGTAQCTFTLAVNQNSKNAQGEWESAATWFNVTLWRDQAERMAPQILKGKKVYVEGSIRSRQWQSDDGVRHERWEVSGSHVLLLDKRENAPADGWKSGKAESDGDEPW